MNDNSSISHTVMRRVRRIYLLRTAIPALCLSGLVFALSLLAIGREVWVAKILANMPSVADVPAVLRFLASAFAHTDLAVQVLVVVATGALVWLARAFARLLAATGRYA